MLVGGIYLAVRSRAIVLFQSQFISHDLRIFSTSPLGLLRERKVDPFKLGVDGDDRAGEIVIVKDEELSTGVVIEGAVKGEESS